MISMNQAYLWQGSYQGTMQGNSDNPLTWAPKAGSNYTVIMQATCDTPSGDHTVGVTYEIMDNGGNIVVSTTPPLNQQGQPINYVKAASGGPVLLPTVYLNYSAPSPAPTQVSVTMKAHGSSNPGFSGSDFVTIAVVELETTTSA